MPDDVGDEIERLALRAFRLCTGRDEWIYAWDAPDEYSSDLYRFWPHRAPDPVDYWEVSFYPDGEDRVFVSQSFDWGLYAYWSYPPLDHWALRVFGQPLLDAFAGHWPRGWSQIVATSGADVAE